MSRKENKKENKDIKPEFYFKVVDGSNNITSTSFSAMGLCSIPLGTTIISPGPNETI